MEEIKNTNEEIKTEENETAKEIITEASEEIREAVISETKEEIKETVTPEPREELRKDVVVFNNVPEPEKKSDFWTKPVTRKFFVISLAIAVLASSLLSAGFGRLFTKETRVQDMQEFKGHYRQHDSSFDRQRRPESFLDDKQEAPSENLQRTPSENSQETPSDNSQSELSDSLNSFGNLFSDEQTPMIGILVYTENSQVIIYEIIGENAKTAGFQVGDIVESVNGKSITSGEELVNTVKQFKSGDIVSVIVSRSGQKMKIKTELE